MAYMNQEKKAVIAAALKAVIPADWKWSLKVEHHSTIVLTISQAPVDLIAAYNAHKADRAGFVPAKGHIQVNQYHLANQFDGELLALFEKITAALNTGNHNRSDISTDYFDVGFYVSLHIGKWNKPFKFDAAGAAIAEAKGQIKAREESHACGTSTDLAAARELAARMAFSIEHQAMQLHTHLTHCFAPATARQAVAGILADMADNLGG